MGHRTTRPHAALRACHIRSYVAALAVLAWLAGAPVLAQTGTAQVDRVIDGDTISVRRDGARVTVVNVHSSTPPARAAQVVAAAAEAWDALATEAADQADQCRRGAELADRTRHRWAR